MSEAIKWRVQYASYIPTADNALLHVGPTPVGTFEIYDDAGDYLLHFPKRLAMPAELFHDLETARTRAESVAAAPTLKQLAGE